MNAHTPAPRKFTLAQAIREIAARPDLPPVKRRGWLSALGILRRLEAPTPPEAVVLDATLSVEKMARASPAALDVSPAYVRNMLCQFKTVLREFGILAPARRKTGPIRSEAWRSLVGMVSSSHHPHRLIAFMGWCDAMGVPPEAVTPETLETYLAEQIATKGGKNIRANLAQVAHLWNRCGDSLDAWPRARLALRPIEVARAPALDTYTAPLQADIARFLDGVSPPPLGKLFGNVGRNEQGAIVVRPVLSPKTVEARRKGVRAMLWAATETGTPRHEITSLDHLICPDVAQRILEWHFQRLGKDKPSGGLVALLDTLTAIAAFKGLMGPQRVALRDLVKAVRPKRQHEMSDRNAGLMTILEQVHERRLLLEMPWTLMDEARRLLKGGTDDDGRYHSPAPMRAAWIAAIAAGVEIEFHLPLRISDLAALHFDRHITVLDQGRSTERWRIAVKARKNGIRVETEISGASAALLREYVDVFRPLGPHPESRWVFPHRDRADQPRPEGHFSEAISEQIRHHTGVTMHVHAFRGFAAVLILEGNPQAFEDIRLILGHSSLETAQRHYLRRDRLGAAERLAAGLNRERRALRVGR